MTGRPNATRRRFGKELRPCCIRCGRRLQAFTLYADYTRPAEIRRVFGYDGEGYFHSKHCAAEWARDQARRLDSTGELKRDFD